MLSKEDLLMRIQQGTPEPNWTVIHAKLSYFLRQVMTYFILLLAVVGLTLYYINMPSHALVLRGLSINSDNALQTWRTIDFTLFAILAIAFLVGLVMQVQDLLARERQLLVLTPQAFLLKLRNKEYFEVYANVTRIVPQIRRGGKMKLHITVSNGQTTIVDLDNRFGKAKVLAPQIVAAQRQAAAANTR